MGWCSPKGRRVADRFILALIAGGYKAVPKGGRILPASGRFANHVPPCPVRQRDTADAVAKMYPCKAACDHVPKRRRPRRPALPSGPNAVKVARLYFFPDEAS